jgi:beta-galactosidase
VEVRSRIEGAADSLLLVTRLRDRAGRVVAETRSIGQGEVRQSLKVTRPDLWSPEQPFLYSAERLLYLGDQLVDHTETPFGVRRVEIDSARGLRINGKPYKLRGGCIHHDNGLLGAAAFDRAEERKVELLKARGFNAVRLSHNPSSSAFLDACDRLGMLVVAEAFDQWREAKNPDDYSVYFDGWWKRDLAAMIDRDRNHPSVILWSIGNEIPEQTRPEGGKTAKMLADAVRALDPTRPVTQAINMTPGPDVTRADGKLDQIATAALDVAGYNYRLRAYEKDHERFPDRVMLGAESYPSDVDRVWRLTDRSPYLIGDFVWAAMDYLGEAAIGRTGLAGNRFGPDEYPWFNAGCGDLDLIGEQRPQSLLRDVVWGLRPLAMSVQRPMPADKRETPFLWGWRDELQSWTWPEAEGASMQVFVYTRGDRVTLELNGQLVGDKVLTEKDGSVAQIAVPYAPGRLVATAYQAGRTIGRQALETVGSAAALRLRVDRPRLRPDRNDLSYVTVEVVDAQGRLVPDAVRVLRASIWGGAELAAFGNANPRGVASFRQPVAKTWHGRALIVLRPTGADASATLTVAADGLKSASAALTIAG